MRKALGLIEDERLVTRRQGCGTFVNDQACDALASRFCNIRGVDGEPVAGQVEAAERSQRPPPTKLSGCDRNWGCRMGLPHPSGSPA
jgi:hypothetical protein